MRDTVSRWLADLLVRELGIPREEVSPGATFEEVGLDLLDVFEIVEAIERGSGVMLSDAVVRELHTLGELDLAVEAVRRTAVIPAS